MNKDNQEKLVQIAQNLDFASQYILRQAEHEYINEKCMFYVSLEDAKRADVLKYLALGSLPYIIEKDQQVAELEAKEKLYKIWSDIFEFPQEGQIGPFIRRATLPIGNLRAKIMIIGEAPGVGKDAPLFNEFDRTLAYGPSSHILRKALLSNKLYYKCYFTNLCKLSLPENRPSTKEDVLLHKHIMIKELKVMQPDILLLLGNHVFEMFHQILLFEYVKDSAKLIKIFHPSYIVRKSVDFVQYGANILKKMQEYK